MTYVADAADATEVVLEALVGPLERNASDEDGLEGILKGLVVCRLLPLLVALGLKMLALVHVLADLAVLLLQPTLRRIEVLVLLLLLVQSRKVGSQAREMSRAALMKWEVAGWEEAKCRTRSEVLKDMRRKSVAHDCGWRALRLVRKLEGEESYSATAAFEGSGGRDRVRRVGLCAINDACKLWRSRTRSSAKVEQNGVGGARRRGKEVEMRVCFQRGQRWQR